MNGNSYQISAISTKLTIQHPSTVRERLNFKIIEEYAYVQQVPLFNERLPQRCIDRLPKGMVFKACSILDTVLSEKSNEPKLDFPHIYITFLHYMDFLSS